MRIPPADELFQRVRALPAAMPLLAALGDAEGVHLVGGAVRDLLREDEPDELDLVGGAVLDLLRKDELDLVVEQDPAEIAERLGRAVRIHDRFGTATVELDGFTYDIARARRETYPRPGALPEVAPASLDEDLLRRDFTVNAAAIALGGPRRGQLAAAPGALDDLEAHRLRVLHEGSFIDDPTRLLRLVRYASRLHFAIEPGTQELARAAVDGHAVLTVSGPRIGAELRLLALEPDPVAALELLRELELDFAIHPGFRLDDPGLARRALELLPGDARPDTLAIAVAARGVAPDELASMLDALEFPAVQRDAILAAATRAPDVAASLARATLPSQIATVGAGAGPELLALAGALGPAEAAHQWLSWLRHARLEIGGDDLLAAGIPPGPAIGRGLRAALAAKLDGAVSGREAELAEALRAAGSTG